MLKEFQTNVQRLFDESVQDQSVQFYQTAADLLAVLHRKVTQPILVKTDGSCTSVIYYNVSVTIQNDLSSMCVTYNSDYQMTFHSLSSCDLHQLSEFFLALERDIPKWRHIWVADNKLRKEKARIEERLKSTMRQFRYDWMSVWTHDDEQRVERFRIKYYNLQACKMCLDNGNPFWENKKTEAEILEECRTLHMNPPVEQWYTDFTDFIDECKLLRDERDRQIEEQQRKEEKMRHLVRIKQLKFEACIKSIEFHQGFNVSVEYLIPLGLNSIFHSSSMDGFFQITFKIESASTAFRISPNDIDHCTPAFTSAIKRINDIIPELHNALVNDGQQHFLIGDDLFMGQTVDDVSEPFSVVKYSYDRKRLIPSPHLASSRVVNRINTIIRKLNCTSYNFYNS